MKSALNLAKQKLLNFGYQIIAKNIEIFTENGEIKAQNGRGYVLSTPNKWADLVYLDKKGQLWGNVEEIVVPNDGDGDAEYRYFLAKIPLAKEVPYEDYDEEFYMVKANTHHYRKLVSIGFDHFHNFSCGFSLSRS